MTARNRAQTNADRVICDARSRHDRSRWDDGQIPRARAILPVKIAAYSSGSNGMRTKLRAPVTEPHHNTLRIDKFHYRPGAGFIAVIAQRHLEAEPVCTEAAGPC